MIDEKLGENLAKVLWYYNFIPDTSLKQKIICPFHQDVNASLMVDLSDGTWFCFGCNEAGDAFTFVKLMEAKYNGLNDLQAFKKYLKILKSDKCSKIKINASQKLCKATQRDLYNEAYDYYHGLKKIKWDDCGDSEYYMEKEYMLNRGFNQDVLYKCKAKITYNKSYPIIFPMLDNGKFKGWVCRTTTKKIEEKRKYLYNEGFSRATTLVGDYGHKKYVVIVEGYMDRLKFIQYGIEEENIVAILGWKMTNQQIQKLKDKGITDIISALDNDVCGKKGTEYVKKFFNVTRFSYLKGVKDPGETTKEMLIKMYNKTIKIYNSMEDKQDGIIRQNQIRVKKGRTK